VADVTIDIKARTQQAQKEIAALGRSFGGLSKTAVTVGAAAAAAVGAAVVSSVNATRKLGDELQKLSIRTGESVEDLSRLKLVAELSDVSFDRLGQTAAGFARRAGEALRSPTSAAAQAFDRLGIEVEGADGKLITFKDALIQTARSMEGMEDPTRRLQIATDVFGRSGAELLPVLDQGAAGIRSMMEEADQLGVVMSTQTAEDSARLNDALAKLSAMAGGLGRRIGEFLIPTLADLAEGAVETAKAIRVSAKGWAFDTETASQKAQKAAEDAVVKQAELIDYLKERQARDFAAVGQQGFDAWTEEIDKQLAKLQELNQRAGVGVTVRRRAARTDPGLGDGGAAGDGGDGGGAGRIARAASAAKDPLAALRRELETLGLTADELMTQRVTGALESLNAGLEAGLLSVADYNARVSEILAQTREQRREDHAETIEQIHEESAARDDAAARRMSTAENVANAVMSLGSLVTAFAIKEGDARTAEQKKAAKAGFAAQQAFAIGSALVNTALAITNALATVQPYPAAIAASIAAGVQGFAQVAAITATSIQGVADAGLMPGALKAAGLNQHTVLAVRNDEAVVDPRGTAALSDMLELSRDRMARDMVGRSGGSQSITLELDGQVLGSITRGYRIADAERGLGYEREVR